MSKPVTSYFKSSALVASLLVISNIGSVVASDTFITVDHSVDHQSIDSFYSRNNLDPSVTLHVREVVVEGGIESASASGKVIVLVHGATFPANVAFDLNFENASLMRALASRGWDVFALDLEGYGDSTRPEVMDNPDAWPDEPAPVTPDVSVANVSAVVDFVRELRGVERVHMLGWSAGAMIEVPRFAIEQPQKLEKIVLYGTMFEGKEKSQEEIATEVDRINSSKNRMGDPTKVERWAGLGTTPDMLLPGLFAVYTEAHLASDPLSEKLGGKVRAPFGRFMDRATSHEYVLADQISVPTLIIRGELDKIAELEDNQMLLSALASDEKELVTIPGGGHFLHMEKVNSEFYAALETFLSK